MLRLLLIVITSVYANHTTPTLKASPLITFSPNPTPNKNITQYNTTYTVYYTYIPAAQNTS